MSFYEETSFGDIVMSPSINLLVAIECQPEINQRDSRSGSAYFLSVHTLSPNTLAKLERKAS